MPPIQVSFAQAEYGKKKKRSGGFHEADTFENWVNAVDENEDEVFL